MGKFRLKKMTVRKTSAFLQGQPCFLFLFLYSFSFSACNEQTAFKMEKRPLHFDACRKAVSKVTPSRSSLRAKPGTSHVVKWRRNRLPQPGGASLVAQAEKNLPAVWETWVQSLHRRRHGSPGARALQEKPRQGAAQRPRLQSGPHPPQREDACLQQPRPRPSKNNLFIKECKPRAQGGGRPGARRGMPRGASL